MAQQRILLDQEQLSCPVCMDLFNDPVTIPCGHNYCMSCINTYWSSEGGSGKYNCPLCRQIFTQRPVLKKNTTLAALAEELKNATLDDSTEISSEASGDVFCDFCTETKLKASKSCLTCVASYCKQHLQGHYSTPALKKHKLIKPISKIQETICSRHGEVMKVFCRTDQQCICHLCSMDDHKDHDTVLAAEERAERQPEFQATQKDIQLKTKEKEKGVKELQQRIQAVNLSADQAVKDCEKIFRELNRLVEQRYLKVKQQIRSQQNMEVTQARDLQEMLQQEITELRRRSTGLEKLAHTEDHAHFLQNFSPLCGFKDSATQDLPPASSFTAVAVAALEVKQKVQAVLSEELMDSSGSPQAEPRTRADLLKFYSNITLDPKTAHECLRLVGERRVSFEGAMQHCSASSDRFRDRWQVLSREGLTGRCYWEVKWSGVVHIAVSYKDISRAGTLQQCGFGCNSISWALKCHRGGYELRHDNVTTSIQGPLSSIVGVYLDHGAGTLSFYSISSALTLLHRVETTFSEPLHPGFWLPSLNEGSAELCAFALG